MLSWFKRNILFFILLTSISIALAYFTVSREQLLVINDSLIKNFIPKLYNNPDQVNAVHVLTWVLLVIEVAIAAKLIEALLRTLRAPSWQSFRAHSSSLWMSLAIFSSIAMAIYEWRIFYGDVSIKGVVLWSAYSPVQIWPYMTANMGVILGWYAFLQLLPMVVKPIITNLSFATNIISSVAVGGIYVAALGSYWIFSSTYVATDFRIYGFKVLSTIPLLELVAFVLSLSLQRRAYVVQGGDVDGGVPGHPVMH